MNCSLSYGVLLPPAEERMPAWFLFCTLESNKLIYNSFPWIWLATCSLQSIRGLLRLTIRHPSAKYDHSWKPYRSLVDGILREMPPKFDIDQTR